MPTQTFTSIEELIRVLEPLMRRIVREELEHFIARNPDVFYLEPDSPLYEDMEDILRRKEQSQVKLHSHAEVWGE